MFNVFVEANGLSTRLFSFFGKGGLSLLWFVGVRVGVVLFGVGVSVLFCVVGFVLGGFMCR